MKSVLLGVLLLVPAFSQRPGGIVSTRPRLDYVPETAVVEAIEFRGVSAELQKAALALMGVRVGDLLTIEVRQRIGRELGRVQKGMTFTYVSGSKRGTARLTISGDC